ncbi:MAG TPA: GNAT family N-acetyltransferase [Candidatus Limnocylindrales bacterium]|nr:GNAT family N-acetyltransferase [Candidatus Limnocylindrales bacterium]
MPTPSNVRIRALPTSALAPEDDAAIRDLLTAAFARDQHGGFTWDDWLHAIGGTHLVLEVDGAIAGHASVVERALEISGRPVRTGYVEAVAIQPSMQRRGLGTQLMRAVNELVQREFEVGALGTGTQPFYEQVGWQIWRGPTAVRVDGREQPTPDEDGYILVLRTPTSPPFELTEPITCEWRSGDAW